jgi:toxin ParE1/3/4
MAEKPGFSRAVLTPAARRDVITIRKWTEKTFGKDAAIRYEALLVQALRDIEADAERPGSQERPDLAADVRAYHLRFSRDRARTSLGIVRNPRHFVIYRRGRRAVIDILRILHDCHDLGRHLEELDLN